MPPKRSRVARVKNLQNAKNVNKQALSDEHSNAVPVVESTSGGTPEAEDEQESSGVIAPSENQDPESSFVSQPEDGNHGRVPSSKHGRRIISMDDLLGGIESLCAHTKACHPPTFTSEVRTGLVTGMKYACHKCGATFLVGEKKEQSDLNHQAVHAALTTGSGYSAMKEQMACMQVPFMAFSTFSGHESNVAKVSQRMKNEL